MGPWLIIPFALLLATPSPAQAPSPSCKSFVSMDGVNEIVDLPCVRDLPPAEEYRVPVGVDNETRKKMLSVTRTMA